MPVTPAPTVPIAFRTATVSSQSTSPSTKTTSSSAPSPAPDRFRISISGSHAANGKPQNQIQFGTAVHVDKPRENKPKFLGMVTLTDNQELQIQAAESKAFHRFDQPGNDITRGSVNAKLRQSALNAYQPGYLEHGSGLTLSEDERKQVTKALKDYGEDLAAIAIVGRNKREASKYLEDKAFIFVFDKDKDEFEDYLKDGLDQIFEGHSAEGVTTSAASGASVTASETAGSVSTAETATAPKKEAYKWRFFRPRVGVSFKGLDFERTKIKAQVELARLKGPAHTEVKVLAKVPFTFEGEYNVEGEVRARRILKYKPGVYGNFGENMYMETTTNYNHNEERLRSTFGVRKQISADSSVGVYGSFTASTGGEDHDAGLGVNFQTRFD